MDNDKQLSEILDTVKRIERFLYSIAPSKTQLLKDIRVVNLSLDQQRIILNLPAHMQKTAVPMLDGKARTADDLSLITSRNRAMESAYLNQLERMGLVEKSWAGKHTIFRWKPQEK